MMHVFKKETRAKAWGAVFGPLPQGYIDGKKKAKMILE